MVKCKDVNNMELSEKEKQRFWSRLKKDEECWNWSRSTNNGYGWFCIRHKGFSKNYYAHRLSWELTNGEIEDGQCVLHRCDNKLCANPDHLFLGSVDDNMKDKVLKRRQLKGSEIATSKLTEQQVREIKTIRSKTTVEVLSQAYNVSKATIINICQGRSWKHIKLK